MKLAPVATELLGYYMDGDNSKHGITNIEYTEHGLRVVAVSYTHLDVYKRQFHHCQILLQKSGRHMRS